MRAEEKKIKLHDDIKRMIVEALRPLKPHKVIMFGSYARGNPGKDSDIDLYVVTDDEFVPENFDEKMELRVKIAQAIDPIRNYYPVDLIVHTRPMSMRFFELNSSFAKEIQHSGERLL